MIITISRQFGSGGRTVGKEVAEKLGLKCYDSELIERIAEESGFSKEYIAENNETTSAGGWFTGAFRTDFGYSPSNQDRMWTAQCKVINDLAEQGDCVFVGRCADYILHGKKDCLRVYIHADDEWRAKRIVEEYGETTEDPKKRIAEKDRRRAAYYRFYTDQKFGASANFDVALNTATFGIDACADMIVYLYQHTVKPEE